MGCSHTRRISVLVFSDFKQIKDAVGDVEAEVRRGEIGLEQPIDKMLSIYSGSM